MDELPDDDKPVFVEEFYPLTLSGRVSYRDYMRVFLEVTQPRAQAYTTYYCANDPAMTNPFLEAICKPWLALVQECATNATVGRLPLKNDDVLPSARSVRAPLRPRRAAPF